MKYFRPDFLHLIEDRTLYRVCELKYAYSAKEKTDIHRTLYIVRELKYECSPSPAKTRVSHPV